MELTNCKLPDRLERLQQLWRERKSAVKAWGDFFRAPQWTEPFAGRCRAEIGWFSMIFDDFRPFSMIFRPFSTVFDRF